MNTRHARAATLLRLAARIKERLHALARHDG
jgi:hypothetical protein